MTGRIPLPGSHRSPAPVGSPAGPVDPQDPVEVTVVLRRRGGPVPLDAVAGAATLDRSSYAERYAADPSDAERVTAFATEHGLAVTDVDLVRRRVELRGTAEQMAAAFGTDLVRQESPAGVFRARTGPVTLPADVADGVTAVLGLDTRPQARPKFRVWAGAPAGAGFLPTAVAAAYDFPTAGDGTGQTVAILELGGGYRDSDLAAYFRTLGVPVPSVEAVPVDGGANTPTGDPSSADGEVVLDIEVAGAVAPGARYVVYFAPNTDRGFLDALTAAVHAQPTPVAVSVSWGGPEPDWTAQAMHAFDDACADAAALGVTVCCAAGDAGSGDGVDDGAAHVDFPASSPHVLACGGTRLTIAAGRPVETVWNDQARGGGATGGGVSAVFDRPPWQGSVAVPGAGGRGVPDVAGDAAPATGYRITVDGTDTVVGGTSAVAPLWAGLLALVASGGGTPGFAVPRLYAAASGAFHDVTEGSNGAYTAGPGWDPCTGLGSPIGTGVAAALSPAAKQPPAAQPTDR